MFGFEKFSKPAASPTESAPDPVESALADTLMADAAVLNKPGFTRDMALVSARLIMQSHAEAGDPITEEMLSGGQLKGEMDQAIDLRLEASAAAQANANLVVGEGGVVEKPQ